MLGYLQIVFLLIVILTHQSDTENCTEGWFGQECMFMCMCLNNVSCDVNGLCPDACMPGYFGASCQYVDLISRNIFEGTATYLRDDNHDTCNSNSLASSVEVVSNQSLAFAFFRLYLRSGADGLGFTTALNDSKIPCLNEKKYTKDNYVDITCDNGAIVNKVTFSGPSAPNVCTVIFCAGRNIALKQQATQISTYENDPLNAAQNVVDGNTDGDLMHGSCSHTALERETMWWELKLNKPAVVYFIEVYNRDTLRFRLARLKVEGFTPYGTKAFEWFDVNNQSIKAVNLIPIPSTTIFQTVRLSRFKEVFDGQSVLTTCEVKVYGETVCPEEKYGLWCEKNCSCSNTEVCVAHSGQCSQRCASGTYGMYCSEPCGAGCEAGKCSARLGTCKCKLGYIGENCAISCDPGWFGDNCMFKCRCANENENCNLFGDCSSGCAARYFGTKCQYLDMLQTEIALNTEPYLRDNREDTCNPYSKATSVTVTLNTTFSFSWFRLQVSKKTNILEFTTQLNGNTACLNERKFPMGNFVDVTCDNIMLIGSVTFTGAIAPDVCTIRYSGGRNVGLKQTATQSSTYFDILSGVISYDASNVIDGDPNMNLTSSSCSRTDTNDTSAWWKLTMETPAVVFCIIIYNRDIEQFRLQNFRLEAITPDGKSAFVWQDTETITKQEYIIPIKSRDIIKDIMIFQNAPANTSQYLTLCEVEVFGEKVCAENKYGLWCNETCNCNSTSICNPVTGICAQGCGPGFYGLYCTLRCNPGCLGGVCLNRLGHCKCKPGYLGETCAKTCNEGIFGAGCKKNCNRNCLSVCDLETKTCECKTLHDRSMCVDCAEGTFGETCKEMCPEQCSELVGCDRRTGLCLACQPGFMGEKCAECSNKMFVLPDCNAPTSLFSSIFGDNSFFPIVIILLGVSASLMMIGLLLAQKKDDTTGEE